MIYPAAFENKVGFDKIRSLINEACISDMGKEYTSRIKFSSRPGLIQQWIDQTIEFQNFLESGESFPISYYFDLRNELSRLVTPGSFIEQEKLFELYLSLNVIKTILSLFNKEEETIYPELSKLAHRHEFPEDIYNKIEKILDRKGKIKDKASEKLSKIRAQLNTLQKKVLNETQKVFKVAKESGWTAENSEISIRNGRLVIPMKAAYKRAIQGFTHDESSSGQTLFIEPIKSFEINNEILELENLERREIIKILTQFTDYTRPYIEELKNLYRYLGMIDFIRAKAIFSKKIKAKKPEIVNQPIIKLKGAFHPVLYLNHLKREKEVVPLDMELNIENRILIISGPNAGGKSVCLKTSAILQYMFQCGLPVPASADSKFSFFDRIFIDIGDEQSIENDLSTYSSHLKNMKFFIQHANSKTIFFIDEFGTGTEPQLGGAIAEASLEKLAQKQAFGVITTHYSNLKTAADKLPGLINGAMLFDAEALQPLYILKTGQPGSSFTFEIAKKTGFPKEVLNRAKKKINTSHLRFDNQLQQLEADKIALEKERAYLKKQQLEIQKTKEKYNQLNEELLTQKNQIISDAQQKAISIIKKSNKEIEKTIREIKESKAKKEITRNSRKNLLKVKEDLEKDLKKKPQYDLEISKTKKKHHKPEIPSSEPVKPGDFVLIKSTKSIGKLLSLKGNIGEVEINGMRLQINQNNLEKTLRKPKPSTQSRNYSSILDSINEKASQFNLSLDVRGMRADEAMEKVASYIEDAVVLGAKEVNILHGKGYGILRQIIRDYLTTRSEIKSFGDAPVELGGAGITRIYFY